MNNITPVCIMLLAAASQCLAQTPPTVERPSSPRIGDTRDHNGNFLGLNCSRWETKRQEANQISVRQCEDKLIYLDANLNLQRATNLKGEVLLEFKPHYRALEFPLFVGKKWTSQYSGFRADKGRKWDSRLECEATAYEPVRVAAGNFDAFRVECIDNWEFGYIFSGRKSSTRWYAPSVGIVVKYASEDREWNYELAAYRQAEPGMNTASR